MLELREKSIQFMYNIFAKNCIDDDKLKFSSEYFNCVVNQAFKDLTNDKKPDDNPISIKLGGQSGSGKTSQLMPAIINNINKDNYVHLAVRFFAKYHPYYDKLIEKYGESNIRENTNGFALMCLFAVSEKLIQNKYNIFFEITLLNPYYEEYFARLLKTLDYRIIYNVLSVPIEVSNSWINNRLLNSNYEKNRIVSNDSINFFYNILPQAISKILDISQIFNENDYFILWNIINKEPLVASNNFDKDILSIFNKNRDFNKSTFENIIEEKSSLKYKTDFYKDFFNKNKNF